MKLARLKRFLFATGLLAMVPFTVAWQAPATAYSLDSQELPPASGVVKHVIIVLHASSSRNTDMFHIGATLQESLPDTLILAPNGPFPSDESGYHWFSAPSQVGADDGAAALNRYIEEVKRRWNVDDAQISLVGSSAGGLISTYAGLHRDKPMEAIVLFAAYMLGDAPQRNSTPVCMIYGDKDHFLPQITQSIMLLRAAGVAVENHVRPGLGHEVDMPGVAIAGECLKKAFTR